MSFKAIVILFGKKVARSLSKTGIGAEIVASLIRFAMTLCGFRIKSHWEWEHWRNGKLINAWSESNIVTNQGLNAILDIMFHAATQISTWYIALFENDYTPLATNTYAVPGYTESSAYGEATRPAYVEAAASSQAITNSANKAEFTINDTKTMYGAALVSANTKGDTAEAGAIMFCSSKFTGSKSVVSGDVLKVGITITAADA